MIPCWILLILLANGNFCGTCGCGSGQRCRKQSESRQNPCCHHHVCSTNTCSESICGQSSFFNTGSSCDCGCEDACGQDSCIQPRGYL